MTTILHIVARAAWKQAETDGIYRAASLEDDGFIHLSKPEQVLDVANLFYQGQADLVLLVVDPANSMPICATSRPTNTPDSSERFPASLRRAQPQRRDPRSRFSAGRRRDMDAAARGGNRVLTHLVACATIIVNMCL